jgi:hypothetical protein
MADLKYKVDIETKEAQQKLNSFKTAVKGIGATLATLGIAKAIKSFVDVGSSVENLSLRFKFLFGSAEEGAKAFDVLTKYASKVPFSLKEIERASGNLAVVSEDANELQELLKITGNVAAVTGLDFKTSGEQIQRAFSGGIAAADIFREKGVRQMLGFKEGATVSIEQTIKRFKEVFGAGGEFGNATDEFAKTLEGTVSMLGDKLFKFQKDVASGFFGELKKQLGDLDKFFQDNGATIEAYAKTIGQGLTQAILGVAQVAKFLVDNLELVKTAFAGIIAYNLANMFLKLSVAMYEAAAAMTALNLAVGKNVFVKIAAGLIAAGTALYTWMKATDDANGSMLEQNKIMADYNRALNAGMDFGNGEENQKKVKQQTEKVSATIEKLRLSIEKDFDKINRELKLEKQLFGLTGFERALKEIEIQEKKTMMATIARIKEQAEGVDPKQTKKLIDDVKAQTEAVIAEKQKQAKAQEELERSFTYGMKNAMDEYVKNVTNGAEQARRVFEQATKGMEDAIVNFVKTGKFNFRSLINDILETMLRSRIQELFARLFSGGTARSNAPGLFDIIGSIGKGIKDIFGGFFADGGMLGAGKYGIAGERGMELVGPGPAQITPMSNTGSVTYNINAVDARSFQEMIAADPQFLFAVTEQGRKTVPEFRR